MKTKDISRRVLKGSKGGSVKRTPDNLFSTDVVEALLGVSEGPIKGLAEGPRSFLIGDTPLADVDGNTNFDSFELIVRNGSELGDDIHSRMGGFGSSTNVNTTLAYNTPVVRSGIYTNIDYVDIRLLISRLVKENNKGSFEHTGKVKIEYKRSDQSTWKAITSSELNPPAPSTPVNGGTAFYPGNTGDDGVKAGYYDAKAAVGATSPAVNSGKKYWFKADSNYRPYILSGGSWVQVSGATLTGSTWTWPNGGKAVYGTTPQTGAAVGHYWINTATSVAYIWNGDVWIEAGSSFTPGSGTTGGAVTVVAGEVKITGKTTTSFVKEFRIPLDRTANYTYDFRVTRTSAANTTELFFDVAWESFSEVTAEVFNFPGLATAQLTARASEQFSSLPEMSGVWEGRIVKVPSNYNATARTYTGIWDGTWKLEYTNNPAFIGHDLVSNARYGMNAYYPVTLNKWDVYEAGKWCDVTAADGTPRFTFNGVVDTARNGREAIDYIFGTFGGRFFDDGNGSGVIRLDTDSAAKAIFSAENVENGLFTYSQTPLANRHNDVTVTFINPDLNWQEDRRRVADEDNIAVFGRNATNIVAVGCTSVEEAIRRGRYKLVTGLTEKTMVSFNTNRAAAYLQPYDVILIADDTNEFGLHGRVKGIVGNNTITLRDPLYLEAGISYRLSFTGIDTISGEYVVLTSDVAAGQSGLRTSIQTTQALPGDVQIDSVFTLHQVGTTFAPKPFRILDIEPSENNDVVKVTAVEVNRAKWPYIDGIIDEIETNTFYDLETSKIPQPVPSARVTSSKVTRGGRVIRSLLLEWEPSPSTFVIKYRVSVSINNGPLNTLAEVASLRYEYSNIAPANYVFAVEPIGYNGVVGRATYFEHQMIQPTGTVTPLEGLVLANTGVMQADGTFLTQLSATWTPVLDVPVTHYEVQWKLSTDTSWQTVAVQSALFQINTPKIGGIYTVRVRAISDSVVVRDWAEATLMAVGDTIAPPTPTNWIGEQGLDFITLKGDRSPAEDFKTFRFYGATASSATLAYLGESAANSWVRRPPQGNNIVRYKVSAVDFAGNESPKTDWIEVVPLVDIITVPVTTPTGLSLSTTLIGNGKARVVAQWNANTEPGVTYEVTIREAAGNPVAFPTSLTRHEWDVTPGVVVFIKVRALTTFQQPSNYTVEQSISAAVDTVPPAAVTNFAATGSFENVWLTWTGVADTDLSHYDIYESSTTTAPVTATAATFRSTAPTFVRSGLSGVVTRNYWVRAVDTSGNKSAWSVMKAATTLASDLSVSTADLAGLIDATSFAVGTEPITFATGTLPTTKTTQYISFGGKLHRWTGSAYTPTIPASDIAGQVTAAQIAALEASKITGQLTNAQIDSVAAAKLTGTIIGTQIGDGVISTAKLAAGSVTAAQIAANTITAAQIAANTITAAQIAANTVTAAQIAANTITAAQIAANAVTANELAANSVQAIHLTAGSVVAGKIAAGAISATEIAAGTIVARNLAVTDFTNLVPNGGADDTDIGGMWSASNGTFTIAAGQGVSGANAFRLTKSSTGTSATATLASGFWMPVEGGESYYAETAIWTDGAATTAGAYYRLYWADKNKVTLTTDSYVDVAVNVGFNTTKTVHSKSVTAPAGARFAYVRLYNHSTQTTTLNLFFDRLVLRLMNGAQLLVNGSVQANHLTAGEVITSSAQIKNAIITEAKISGTLNANKIAAGTAFANSITVNGTTLNNIETWADDPAARVNARTTKIAPGLILISGSTTLASWQKGGDATKIDGGQISANTISANKLEIGSRGVTLTGIEWEHNKPGTNQCSWTAGAIRYTNDAGSETSNTVAAGSVTWSSGVVYIYWIKGATSFSTTTTQSTAQGSDRLILATYEGGVKLDADFGRTIVDGSKIKTNTITATQIAANTITAAQIAANTITAGQIATNAITANELASNSVQATHITAGAITADKVAAGAITADKANFTSLSALSLTVGGVDIQNLAVSTGKIANNAVTGMAATDRASQSLPANASTWVNCMSVTFTQLGGNDLVVWVSGEVGIVTDSGGGPAFEWRILVGGTQVWKSGGNVSTMMKTFVGTSVAGSTQILVQVDTNGSGGGVNLRDMALVAIEYKK